MAKAAFATWNHRIAPVFDVARSIWIVETAAGNIVHQGRTQVAGDIPNLKASQLTELGVDTLVCGAISNLLHAIIVANGIQVIAFVAGDLREVVHAWMCGKLAGTSAFAMPGYRYVGGHRYQGGILHECSHRESRERGVPCVRQHCAKCSVAMEKL
jgi:predicted Fe-Mo cluster-binding NifX family protein